MVCKNYTFLRFLKSGCGVKFFLLIMQRLTATKIIWYIIPIKEALLKASLIVRDRFEFEDGDIAEVRVWEVPSSEDKPHGYKYSLVYIVNGKRVIGYDNAEGKGDHRHYHDKEEAYEFKSIDRLFEDFYKDVRRFKNEN